MKKILLLIAYAYGMSISANQSISTYENFEALIVGQVRSLEGITFNVDKLTQDQRKTLLEKAKKERKQTPTYITQMSTVCNGAYLTAGFIDVVLLQGRNLNTIIEKLEKAS